MRTLLVVSLLNPDGGKKGVTGSAGGDPAVMGSLCELKIFFPNPFRSLLSSYLPMWAGNCKLLSKLACLSWYVFALA
jgi:hypothetical protein